MNLPAIATWSLMLSTACLPARPDAIKAALPSPGPSSPPPGQVEAADYVLWNGRIYTMKTSNAADAVEAIAIRGERVVFTGTRQDAEKYVSPATKVIDLEHQIVLPGFTDAHIHPLDGGKISLECDLSGAADLGEAMTRLDAYAKAHPEKSWIRAWNLPVAVSGGNAAPRDVLDPIIPDRPVLVFSDTGHTSWVNSKALEYARIDSSTTDPTAGTIHRRLDSTEPDGLLAESAQNLVADLAPPFTPEQRVAALRYSVQMLHSHGITSIVEARSTEEEINTFLALADRDELNLHVSFSLYADLSRGMPVVKETLELKRKVESKIGARADLRLDQVKLFIDGTVEEKTAAMESSYTCCSPDRGMTYADEEIIHQIVLAFDQAGLQIHVHAIGDRGVRIALDAFEKAIKVNGRRDSRHHIAHLHVIHPRDLHRFAQLGVTANFQTLWASGDDSLVKNVNPGLLGPEREGWQYPVGAIVRSGASVVFGSDWSVTSANPMLAIQTALTRRGPENVPRPPWMPEQRISLSTALEGYTRRGAWIGFRERERGTLEEGKLADLVVLDRDIFAISPFSIGELVVQKTMFRGRVVFDRGK